MSFKVRQLEDMETIGAKLHAMRRRLAVSLDQAAERTHIQRKYLAALEADDYNTLPEPLYTRNFIRTYAKLLGADVDYFLRRYDEECGTCDVVVDPMRLPRQKVAWAKFLVAHRIFKVTIIAVVGLAIVGYLGWQIRSIMAPPDISIYEPIDGLATNEARVKVSGQAEEQVELWINGVQVILDVDGNFSTVVDLERGLNIIKIEASKRYSKTAELYRTVVFER
ncbi:MAG: helix-turn-helix domain-containing protein [Candidatus Uhrbacteria bacterium]|nr:helix-turn-helix domain-containing protein [Patescibacteria group bacterium]MBU1907162.1 helix-turn-helix domain-containing protein [Patescibacteria group bacterium]